MWSSSNVYFSCVTRKQERESTVNYREGAILNGSNLCSSLPVGNRMQEVKLQRRDSSIACIYEMTFLVLSVICEAARMTMHGCMPRCFP